MASDDDLFEISVEHDEVDDMTMALVTVRPSHGWSLKLHAETSREYEGDVAALTAEGQVFIHDPDTLRRAAQRLLTTAEALEEGGPGHANK